MRITHEGETDSRVSLRIEGCVVDEWIALLELECSDFLLSGYAVSVDLNDVVLVDHAGVEALRALDRAGVEIRCRAGVVASVLEAEGVRVLFEEVAGK